MKIWNENFDSTQLEKSLPIYTDDPVWVRVMQTLTQKKLHDYKRKVIQGNEITKDWLFVENQNMSLFSEKVHWNILNAEKISPTTWKFIEENISSIKNNTDSIFHFFFPLSSKKKLDLSSLVIDKVAFWEIDACVRWFFKIQELVAKDLEQYWPWDQELTLSEHFQLMQMYADKMIEIKDLKNYFVQQKFEQEKFELLTLLDQKKWSLFLNNIKYQLERYEKEDKLRLIQLIKSHVFKIAKIKEQLKPAPKSYSEKKIFTVAQQWQLRDVLYWLKLFSEWEILAKAGEKLDFPLVEEWLSKTK